MSNYQRKLIISYFKQPKNKVQINYDQIHYHLHDLLLLREVKNDNYSNCKTNHFANGQLQGKLFTFQIFFSSCGQRDTFQYLFWLSCTIQEIKMVKNSQSHCFVQKFNFDFPRKLLIFDRERTLARSYKFENCWGSSGDLSSKTSQKSRFFFL